MMESPQEAAVREWEEETGLKLPPGRFVESWDASNGRWKGFLYVINSEKDIDLFNRDPNSNPDRDSFTSVAWVHLSDMENHNLRPELLDDLPQFLPLLQRTASKILLRVLVKGDRFQSYVKGGLVGEYDSYEEAKDEGQEILDTLPKETEIKEEEEEKLDPQGGCIPNISLDQLQAADFITLPDEETGTNCILPWTEVSPLGDLVRGLKSHYSGEVVEITVSSGARISLTINHPVLTENGFVPAGKINQGHNLASNRESVDRFIDANIQHTPTSIEHIFNSISSVADPFSRTTTKPSVLDFHGDGAFIDGNIQIVRANSELRSTIYPYTFKGTDKGVLSSSLLQKKPLSSSSPSHSHFQRILLTSSGFMCRLCHTFSLWTFKSLPEYSSPLSIFLDFFRFREPILCGFGSASYSDPIPQKYTSDSRPTYPKFYGDGILRFPRSIEFNNVVNVRRFHYSGPVYDLETTTGLIVTNAGLISNCSNCVHQQGGICQFAGEINGEYVDIRGQKVNKRNCCGAWDNQKALRTWKEGSSNKVVSKSIIIKDEGQPCKQGETASRSHCIPASGESKPDTSTQEPKQFVKPKATRGEMSSARREGTGKEARVILADGSPAPSHIKPAMVAPDWTDVEVSLDPNADVQVIAKDNKGRPKIVYKPSYTMKTAALKFSRVHEAISKARDMYEENQRNRQGPNKEEADCLWLIQEQGTRPGSGNDTKAAKKAYGATTLLGKHIKEKKNGKIYLDFIGKKGVHNVHEIRNPELGAMLKERAERAGKDGRLFNTNDNKLRDYTHGLDGGHFTPKDFRTLIATMSAGRLIHGMQKPTNMKEYKAAVKEVSERVSSILGNRPQECLKSYINPNVFADWRLSVGVEG